MANATTRAHVASPTPKPIIPVASRQTSTANQQAYEIANSPIAITPPQNRREKRKQKKSQQQDRHDSALPTPTTSDTETPRKPPNNPPRQNSKPRIPHQMPLTNNAAALQKAYPLLICSIGNPGAPYANTLHSAGHTLTSYLSTAKNYKPFTKGLSGLVSRPSAPLSFSIIGGYRRVEGDSPSPEDDWTFWQSTAFMNGSGNSVRKAYNEWLRGVRQMNGASAEGRLVVVHDELESELGKVTVRDGAASAKGHNGLKSCQQQLGGVKWWRVGVGIGRPESRDPDVVSKYVLGKMTAFQRAALEKSALNVFKALESIAEGKK